MTFFGHFRRWRTRSQAEHPVRDVKTMSISRLHEVFDLKDDGKLINKTTRNQHSRAGEVAGTAHNNGYLIVGVDGQTFLAHRVVFAMTHGRWPEAQVDHIDGDRSNNAPSNLREASASGNAQNKRRPRSDSALSVMGVTKAYGSYYASISLHGVAYHLGVFLTAREASEVYQAAKSLLHPYAADAKEPEFFYSKESLIAYLRFKERIAQREAKPQRECQRCCSTAKAMEMARDRWVVAGIDKGE